MAHRLARFFIFALLAVAVIGAARLYQSRIDLTDPATGNLISHTQTEWSAPLRAPDPLLPTTGPDRLPLEDEAFAQPRNLIVFIGDGMGVGSLSAADMLLERPNGSLTMTTSRNLGLVRTWAADDLTTDSAASATALATGFKTNKKMIGMLPDGRRVLNLFELAHHRGFATGVITTSGLADATPAAFTSHIDHRDKYHLILPQIVASTADLLIGGSWIRKDKARLNPPYLELVGSIEGLAADSGRFMITDPSEITNAELPLLAFYPPRSDTPMDHGPPLADSTRIAIDLLLADPDGFVLVVESETTDESAHNLDINGTVAGVRELDAALEVALELVGARGDTLIIVTADHDTGSAAVIEGHYETGVANVRWSTGEHSAQYVPLFAFGPGAERFRGVLDNTEIPRVVARLLGLGDLPQLAVAASD